MRKLMLAGAAAAALVSTGLASTTAANAAWICRPGFGCGPTVYRPFAYRPFAYRPFVYRPYAFARPFGYRPYAYRWGHRHVW
jgi:hypothetical protein